MTALVGHELFRIGCGTWKDKTALFSLPLNTWTSSTKRIADRSAEERRLKEAHEEWDEEAHPVYETDLDHN